MWERLPASKKDYRETFDLVSGRAVAPISQFLEIAAGFVQVGGTLLLQQSETGFKEYEQLKNSAEKLGFEPKPSWIKSYSFDEKSRYSFSLKKVKVTPKEYPRSIRLIRKKSVIDRVI